MTYSIIIIHYSSAHNRVSVFPVGEDAEKDPNFPNVACKSVANVEKYYNKVNLVVIMR